MYCQIYSQTIEYLDLFHNLKFNPINLQLTTKNDISNIILHVCWWPIFNAPFLFWQGSCNPRIQSAHDNKNYTLILKPRLIYFLILHVLVDCNILTPLTDSRNHHLWSKLHKYALFFDSIKYLVFHASYEDSVFQFVTLKST